MFQILNSKTHSNITVFIKEWMDVCPTESANSRASSKNARHSKLSDHASCGIIVLEYYALNA